MAEAMSFSFIYIWCKRNPIEKITFQFGIPVTSAYLPWVIIVY